MMEDEIIISGYCRCLDQNRIVTAEREDGKWYFDCSFGNCPHEASCQVAQKLREIAATCA